MFNKKNRVSWNKKLNVYSVNDGLASTMHLSLIASLRASRGTVFAAPRYQGIVLLEIQCYQL
jgi:hypothetical protein